MSTTTTSKSAKPAKKVDLSKPHLIQAMEGLYSPDGQHKPRIDKEKGVIYDVKILGNDSKNGRYYPPAVVMEARDLYEGARVNVDHPAKDETGSRSYHAGLGVLRGVYEQNGGLYAKEFHYNIKHPAATQLEWDVEHAPNSLGFSHNAMVLEEFRDNKLTVRKIQKVKSVDLVSSPATTKGIFEGEGMSTDGMGGMDGGMGGTDTPVQEDDAVLTMLLDKIREIYAGEGDCAAKAKAMGVATKAILKVSDELQNATVNSAAGAGDGTSPTSGEGGSGGEMNTEESLKKTIADKDAEIKGLKNREKARKLFTVAKILEPTDQQVMAVAVLESEEDQKKLVDTWKGIANTPSKTTTTTNGTTGAKPKSTPANVLESTGNDAKKPEEEKFDPMQLAASIRK